MAKKPLEIDCVAGSMLRDTQGEVLSIEGCDISKLENGTAIWTDNHGKGFYNNIGRITYGKKIFKAEDCEDDRQRYYWDKIKAPYIYAKGYLYDDEDHPNGRAAAAVVRNIHKTDSPLKMKASVEGGVIARGINDPSLLARTKLTGVALTLTPANNATLVEPLNLDKSSSWESDLILIKSVMHLAETNVPSFRHIVRDASATRVHENISKISELIEQLGLENSISTPSKQQIIEKAIEHKIYNNISHILESLDDSSDDLVKGLREALAGAAMTTALGLGSPAEAKTSMNLKKIPSSHQEAYRTVSGSNPILGAIGLTESNGGTNYAHPKIKDPKSPHFGHTAGGMFGMLPNTAALVVKHDKDLAKKYPSIAKAAKDVSKNHGTITNIFNSNPEAAIDFANSYLNRNKEKTKNIPMLIYSWNHGLKGTWNKYHKSGMDPILDSDYVKKTVDHLRRIKYSNASKNPQPKMEKALTAGYGGAGVPTGGAGGSVLQTESLDDGRVSFKYMTCDKCGKEQIYAKHQVRCRSCGKNFSLEQLDKVMSGRK